MSGASQQLDLFNSAPALFAPNEGQWVDSSVKYAFSGSGANILFTEVGPVFQVFRAPGSSDTRTASDADLLPQTANPNDVADSEQFSIQFHGANPVSPVGVNQAETVYNYLVGDPSLWRGNVPTYEKVAYNNLYAGIDLDISGQRTCLKYEFHVAPGADYRQIRVSYTGVEGLSIDSEGALHVQTRLGELVDDAPYIYQVIDGQKVAVAGDFVLLDNYGYTFQVTGSFDSGKELVIDPNLAWSTYLGGSGDDYAYGGLAVDAAGSVYVTGYTYSSNFPSTAAAFDRTYGGSADVFVAKLNATGNGLVYATYLGGSGLEMTYGIDVDAAGNAYVTGYTNSSNFPTTAGAFGAYRGGRDVFVTKLNASGSGLVYSMFLGGSLDDYSGALTVDAAGYAYVTGYTSSSNFPTTAGAFDTTHNGTSDAFVTKIKADGSGLAYSTFLGGSLDDCSDAIAVDTAGSAYVTGYTNSSNFPTTAGAFDTTFNAGLKDVFLARLSATGSGLVYSTFMGGSGEDVGAGVAVDAAGNIYLSGYSKSSNFPTTAGAFDRTFNAGADAFVAKFHADSNALAYSTYLGGSGDEYSVSIGLDAAQNVCVAGFTSSSNFPTTAGALDRTFNGGSYDGFLATLNANGSGLLYSTYLGGSGEDRTGMSLAVDGGGNAYVTGCTNSSDFPTTAGAYDTTLNGSRDVFVVKISGLVNVNPLVVTTAGDTVDPNDRLTSLREAVACANAYPGDDAISFDGSLAGQTITLTLGQLEIADTSGKTTITGLGAAQLTISGNSTSRVFSVAPGATVELSGVTITEGKTSSDGGGIYNEGLLAITGSTITGNSATHSGGGICNHAGTTTITDSTISANVASANGGGIANVLGTVTIARSTISGNLATNVGGGTDSNGTLTIVNSTIANNLASSALQGFGGGAILQGGGRLTLDDSTISGNTTSGQYGGIYSYNGGTAALNNTILAGNTANGLLRDFFGTVTAKYSLIEDTTGTTFDNGSGNNITGVAPAVGPLADNGGPTKTMALLPGSVAINAGNDALIPPGATTDQRGRARTLGSAVDIGACESSDTTTLAVWGTPGSDAFVVTVDASTNMMTVTLNGVSLGTLSGTPFVHCFGQAGTDSITAQGAGADDTIVISAESITVDDATIGAYDIETRLVNGQAGGDTIRYLSGSATIDGGTETDTLVGPDGANTWQVTASGAGNVNGALTFKSIENLTGGTQEDVFQLIGTAGVAGHIDGGGGSDRLDYSGSTRAATVNLATLAATGTGGILNLEALTGSPLADTLKGPNLLSTWDVTAVSAGNLNGSFGFQGVERLNGGTGSDTYRFDTDSPLGTMTLSDLGGVDTVDFSNTTMLGVTLNLSLATSQTVNANLTLTLSSASALENVVGGSGADSLTGNAMANRLEGGPGNDTLDGGSGSDIYLFDADTALGSDTLTDSGGIDSLDFSATTGQAITVNLGLATAQIINPNLTLTLSSTATMENVIGGALGDTLTGNTLANSITGGPGDDLLSGGAGNDTYVFDYDLPVGNDTAVELADGGTDTFSYSLTTTVGVTAVLPAEIENAVGGAKDDYITGNALANNLNGGAGNDTLVGDLGNDTLTGGAGDDVLAGGGGNDTYAFDADTALGNDIVDESGGGTDTLNFSATTTQAVTVNLGTKNQQTINPNLKLTLSTAGSIENLVGGSMGDTLTGNALANTITGGPGNDTLVGGAGADTYLFDADMALGTDTLDESGGGIDTLNFSATTTTAVSVNLSLAEAQVVVSSNLSLILSSGSTFENVIGSGSTTYGDMLTGNSLNNRLEGRAGNDTLSGGLGDDALVGGAGNDNLAGGSGNDLYVFDADVSCGADTLTELPGGGRDTLDFSLTTVQRVAVNLSSVVQQTVNSYLKITLSAGDVFENVIGGAKDDQITGNALANWLVGGLGNDSLWGGDGRDLLMGGSGLDTLRGGLGEDILIGGKSTFQNETSGAVNRAAMEAILDEWARTDLSSPSDPTGYLARVNHLLNGGGLNSSYTLNTSTVQKDSSAVDQLFGEADLDWFLASPEDGLPDPPVSAEIVTTV